MPRTIEQMKKSGFFKNVIENFRASHSQQSAESTSGESSRGGGSSGESSNQNTPQLVAPDLPDFDEAAAMGTPRIGDALTPNDSRSSQYHTALAFDPMQRLIAIGTRSGTLRILGRPGVETSIQHGSGYAVIQLHFVIGENALISITSDDSLHYWSLNKTAGKRPELVQSLKFQKERIVTSHLPLQSKWMYIGTDRGNVHVLNIETFSLSGYLIYWNKAIDWTRKTHPGNVVHLSDCPTDCNKLLIGYDSGLIVLWDLRSKAAETRYSASEGIRSVSWHHDGRQFVASHSDGSVTTWDLKASSSPVSMQFPHSKNIGEDLKPEPCKPIWKVEWKTIRGDEALVIFSGGQPYGSSAGSVAGSCAASPLPPRATPPVNLSASNSPIASPTPMDKSPCKAGSSLAAPSNSAVAGPSTPSSSSAQLLLSPSEALSRPSGSQAQQQQNQALASSHLTVMRGKGVADVIQMNGTIVDFVTLCENPFEADYNDPYAVLVLLYNDLALVDLSSPQSPKKVAGPESEGANAAVDQTAKFGYPISDTVWSTFDDMTATVYLENKDVSEQPKQTFLKRLFVGAQSSLDREELFGGAAAGKPSAGMVKYIPGSADALQRQTSNLGGEMAKLRAGFEERGEKLQAVEDRTQSMSNEADAFSSTAHQLMLKYRDKKWYQL